MSSSSQLINASILTVFAREILEGSIIIAEYRTVVMYGDSLEQGLTREKALRAITVSSLLATLLAIIVIFAVAVPLALLSKDFDTTTSELIEGVSKIVASVCMLQLSLKLPKWLGFYGSKKAGNKEKMRGASIKEVKTPLEDEQPLSTDQTLTLMQADVDADADCEAAIPVDDEAAPHVTEVVTASNTTAEDTADALTLKSIRFNIAWNIWREVAECGVFLIPSFLTGDDLAAIPLSAFIGIIIGGGLGYGIYYTNQKLQQNKKLGFSLFVIVLVSFLSAGLLTDGVHNVEEETTPTKQVWAIPMPSFWDDHKIPMTFLEPFGYSSSRTVLQIVVFWSWLAMLALLHYLKYKRCTALATRTEPDAAKDDSEDDVVDVSVTNDAIAGESEDNTSRNRHQEDVANP
ncbi:hypothetical protein MPSEU_000284500 [Mayamaea pseudoterrestris]|nr:hypothetical protein MPSEU_000284500 [Mayamaea pseudoterrestris]